MAVIKTQFTLRLSPIDHAKIKKIAEIENRSMTNMIETLIKQKIAHHPVQAAGCDHEAQAHNEQDGQRYADAEA